MNAKTVPFGVYADLEYQPDGRFTQASFATGENSSVQGNDLYRVFREFEVIRLRPYESRMDSLGTVVATFRDNLEDRVEKDTPIADVVEVESDKNPVSIEEPISIEGIQRIVSSGYVVLLHHEFPVQWEDLLEEANFDELPEITDEIARSASMEGKRRRIRESMTSGDPFIGNAYKLLDKIRESLRK